MTEDKNELVIEIADQALEMVSGISVLSIIGKGVKLWYCKNIREKWTTFLQYAIDIKDFFKEIEENQNLLQYLSDYFESVRITPSFLAIKTMALIFREFQKDKTIQQRTCRAFAGITDDELDIFIKLYTDIKKNNQNLNKKNECKEEKYSDDLKFYINDLSNRGFLFMRTNTGFISYDTDINFNYTLEFNSISDMYFKYIKQAEKLKNIHIGSTINN